MNFTNFPYWDICDSHRTGLATAKNGGNLRLIRKRNVLSALIKYDVWLRSRKEYESLQAELATINQHLEKLLDPLIIEKATRAYTEEQLAADTIINNDRRKDLPSDITILKLADADKKILLKYIIQVKTLYLEYLRDNISERKLADETLTLVIKEYDFK